MGLNPEEAQMMERDAVQQKIDEMQQEIEEQSAPGGKGQGDRGIKEAFQ